MKPSIEMSLLNAGLPISLADEIRAETDYNISDDLMVSLPKEGFVTIIKLEQDQITSMTQNYLEN